MLSIFARVLETLFIIGIIGSIVVVILTFVEDIKDVGPEEEIKAKRAEEPAKVSGLAGAPNASLNPR